MKNTGIFAAALASIMLWAGGCASSGGKGRGDESGEATILLDGAIAEWPEQAAAVWDDHYVYVRFCVQDEQFTLQSAPRSVALYFDTDASAATGAKRPGEPFEGLGIDLEVVFSPGQGMGGKGTGVMMWRVGADGARASVPIEDFDFQCAPTYASSWYEARLSRTPADAHGLPSPGLLGPGTLRGVMALLGPDGGVAAWADPFEVRTGGVCAGGPALEDAEPPARPRGALRIVSWNVERSSPAKNPARFKRVLEALAPDVVLVQEWDAGTQEELAGWFTAMLPRDRPWGAVKAPGRLESGGGVAVVSALPIEPATTPAIRLGEGSRSSPVRFISATVSTPLGPLHVATAHLKCCGSSGSPEDVRRKAEADAINLILREAWKDAPGLRVIAGDFNLVGTRPPLDALRAGIDADGSDLSIAAALTHGDLSYATWRDSGTTFGPGRLDYLVYSDSTARVARAFVLDTARLTEGALARMGLDREDTREASDHMPLVVDLVAR